MLGVLDNASQDAEDKAGGQVLSAVPSCFLRLFRAHDARLNRLVGLLSIIENGNASANDADYSQTGAGNGAGPRDHHDSRCNASEVGRGSAKEGLTCG